jgi:hypothetical protein
MPIAKVTVNYVNAPAAGKQYGSIKTEELGYLSVKPGDLALFAKGHKYEVEYEERGQYKNFVRLAAPPPGAPAQAAGNDDVQRMIFVTGVVGRAMGSGKFGASEIKELTLEANEAFRELTSQIPF